MGRDGLLAGIRLTLERLDCFERREGQKIMGDEKKNLPDGAAGPEDGAEHEVETPDVGVSAETEAEGSSESPAEKLERIAEEHNVPIEKDPKDAQAAVEASSSDDDRDIRGGDTKEKEDSGSEPPD